ncbi:MAG TPA: DUF3017 domain-containing protein [Streptosporangiaceae bacterium]|nr:DUF3017 domain-containing protein [Streptosporangiaceae bacterium]
MTGRHLAGAQAARQAPSQREMVLPYLVVVAGCGAGLAWLAVGGADALRGGSLTLAGAVAVAALARLVLPQAQAGLLASRKRFTDVVTLTALAAGLAATGLLLPT